MTLPTWQNLVKPERSPAIVIWVTGLLTLCTIFALQSWLTDAPDRDERYGELLAVSLAALAVEPLVKQDPIALGMLSNRVARLPGVDGVAVYGVDDQVLSSTNAKPQGPAYSQPITFDDSVIGYVRVTAEPRRFNASLIWPWLLTALLILSLPWLWAWAQRALAQLHSWRHLRSPPDDTGTGSATAGRMTGRIASMIAGRSSAAAADLAADGAGGHRYLLLANLLNQLSFDHPQRLALLEHAQRVARKLAALHGGEVEVHTEVSVALWFPATAAADRAFDLVCAALLLARYLQACGGPGLFQVALHCTGIAAGYTGNAAGAYSNAAGAFSNAAGAFSNAAGAFSNAAGARIALLSDAALLAAAAREGEVILSAEATAGLERPERLLLQSLEHPLAEDLVTSGATCHRLSGLVEGYSSLVDSQLESMLSEAQSEETDRRSTF